MYLKGTGRSHI